MLSRAEANGLLVIATDGKVTVKPPDTDSKSTLKVTYGFDLMEFTAELDARTQHQRQGRVMGREDPDRNRWRRGWPTGPQQAGRPHLGHARRGDGPGVIPPADRGLQNPG